ncbi:Urocanate hydratase 1 (Silurana), partial [Caligus rogercresseyi]
IALFNALRYFPPSTHPTLAPEFAQELKEYGHIYMYRFVPKHIHASAIVHMILNNLDPEVAQFPEELVTYGGNGQHNQNVISTALKGKSSWRTSTILS